MKDSLKHIGENIRTARKKKDLTLDVLSGLSGVSESFLGMVERGASSLSLGTFIAVCDALDVTADSLLMEGREEVNPRPTDKRDTLLTMLKTASNEDVEFLIDFVKLCRSKDKLP